MKNHVFMSVSNDLLTDRRVDRSCLALLEHGFSVKLVGRRFSRSDCRTLSGRVYQTERMYLFFKRKALFYAELNLRLFLKMLVSGADLFYANDTDTLLAAYWAARIRKKQLFFDAHELFPEVPELQGRHRVKRVWERIEKMVLPQIAKKKNWGAMTVCQSISDYYAERFGLKMSVVRNVPNYKEPLPKTKEHGKPYVLLYQGALNKGRGIEQMITAMEWLPDCRLDIIGEGDLCDSLFQLTNTLAWKDRIRFLGRKTPQELELFTPTADLGLVLLENCGLSYYYSLPNRIGDFVMAGVPVMASDFPEIRNVVSRYNVGTLVDESVFENFSAQTLASKVIEFLQQWNSITQTEKEDCFFRARKDLNWEMEKKQFWQSIDAIFQTK